VSVLDENAYVSLRFSIENHSCRPTLVVTVFLTTLPYIFIDALYPQLKLALHGIPADMLTRSNTSNSVPPPVRCSRHLASSHDCRVGASSAGSTPGMLPRRRGPKRHGGNRGRDAVDGKLLFHLLLSVDVLDVFCCSRCCFNLIQMVQRA
jgi:hypothetical protein